MSATDNTTLKNQLNQQITDKSKEVVRCNRIKAKLSIEKGNLETYQKTWKQQYRKHCNSEIASQVVIKDVFEGTIAGKLKKSYLDKIKNMQRLNFDVTDICTDLELQISKLNTYVTKLQKEVTDIRTQLDNMEG